MDDKTKKLILTANPELRPFIEQQETNQLMRNLITEFAKERSLKVDGIEMIKGEPGEPGYTPVKNVDYFDGNDGYTPVKDVDYFDGIDGKTPTKKELLNLIVPLIPDPIPGEPGLRGSPDSPTDIADKLNTLTSAVDVSVIKGAITRKDLDNQDKKVLEGMAKVDGRIKLIDQRWHGAGLSKVSHDGTLSGDGTPSNPLIALGSSPLTTKGDVFGYSTTNARIPVGSNNQVLTADSTQTLGVKWATPTTGTITGSGTSGQVTTWNGTSSITGSANMTFSGSNLKLGVSGSTSGTIQLAGSTSGLITLGTYTAAGTYVFSLPPDGGTNGYFLKTDGFGATSWATASATPAGANTQVQYNNSSAFGASDLFSWNNASKQLILGKSGDLGQLNLYGFGTAALSLQGPNISSPFTLVLPPDTGTSGYVLTTSGGGTATTSWTNPSTLSLAAGVTGSVQFNTGGALTGNTDIFWDNTNKLLGVQTAGVPIAAGNFISAIAIITPNPIGMPMGSTLTPSLPIPAGDTVTQAAPLTVGSYNGMLTQNSGAGSVYLANGYSWTYQAYNVYFDGSTYYYQNAIANVTTSDNSDGLNLTWTFSWSATPTGGNYTKTILYFTSNQPGVTTGYYDAGGIGGSGSITDDGSLGTYNWGSSSFPSGFTASPDFIANNTTYNYDVYAIGTSPSGHSYFSLGDSPTFTDNNDSFPFGLSLNNANGFQVKFHETSPNGSFYKIINSSTSFTQRTNSSSDSGTLTPTTYLYAPDAGLPIQYFRETAYRLFGGHRVYGTPTSFSSSNTADGSVGWYSQVNIATVAGVTGYVVEFSTDGTSGGITKHFDIGATVPFYDDALTLWIGGVATLTPTSYLPPSGFFERDGTDGLPNVVIQDTVGTNPILQFLNNSGTKQLNIKPASTGSWDFTFPTSGGTSGYVLQTNGSGVTSWVPINVGTVTSIDILGSGTGLSFSGGPITTSGAFTVSGTLVVANGGTGATTLLGAGIPTVVGNDRKTGLTAAQALATYTVPASDSTFIVSANVLITSSTLHSFGVTVSYTDESNTARVLTLNFSQLTGAFVTTLTNALGASAYEGVPVHIRCKASTTIIIQSTGTFTTLVYNLEERIIQE